MGQSYFWKFFLLNGDASKCWLISCWNFTIKQTLVGAFKEAQGKRACCVGNEHPKFFHRGIASPYAQGLGPTHVQFFHPLDYKLFLWVSVKRTKIRCRISPGPHRCSFSDQSYKKLKSWLHSRLHPYVLQVFQSQGREGEMPLSKCLWCLWWSTWKVSKLFHQKMVQTLEYSGIYKVRISLT